MHRGTGGQELWDDWLHSSLGYLRQAQLLRTLRPTVWCNSSSEALIHRADLDAWLAGQPPVVRHYDHCTSLGGAVASAATSAAAAVPVVQQYDSWDGVPYSSQEAVPDSRQDAGGGGSGTRCRSCGRSDCSSGISGYGCSSSRQLAVELAAARQGSTHAEGAGSRRSSTREGGMPPHGEGGAPPVGASGHPSAAYDPSSLVRLRLFSLNDYLGLASHPEVGAAAARAATQVGLGPRSSGLVAGYTHSHRQLEEGLARLKGTEDCLLFPTGFAANLALMTTLAYAAPAAPASSGPPGPPPAAASNTSETDNDTTPSGGCTCGNGRRPSNSSPGCAAGVSGRSHRSVGAAGGLAIFSDELNHASIIDGARLAARGAGSGAAAGFSGSTPGSSFESGSRGGGVQLHVYRHNDLEHLEELLSATPPGVRRLVVTDSLFSMDGDFADLRGLAALKRRHPFYLGVDEAHATLVCGEAGGGAAEAMGVADQVDLHVGTLSKAFGALGGFIGCSGPMKQLLLNRGRAFVYSTSLPVPVVEAAAAAMRVSQRESWRRTHVWSLVQRLGAGLGVPALSPIVPLVVGPEGPTLELSSRLLAAGLHVPAIRPPTVPAGTCRLRVSLSAAHTYADVDELIRLVRQSDVPLVRLPHLLDPRAALPPPDYTAGVPVGGAACASGAGGWESSAGTVLHSRL